MEHPAAAFKARGTPEIMRLHEIMGIESNRRWGVCSLNEFRKVRYVMHYSSSCVCIDAGFVVVPWLETYVVPSTLEWDCGFMSGWSHSIRKLPRVEPRRRDCVRRREVVWRYREPRYVRCLQSTSNIPLPTQLQLPRALRRSAGGTGEAPCRWRRSLSR